MSYNVFILRRAQKELSGLSGDVFSDIKQSIQSLGHEPRPLGCRKLSGREGWRIRIGNYRIIYEIDNERKDVTVLDIGHRKDIYR
ncbi:type II toxin-antitoxin system RelE family toxin [Candidatus Magnetominusculus dajiuhuensis]|uniref:type II toxin-antitoxin system RelE family toxin n=1 Tax=Candidatus Magnetominusculus dajiuhuensis TaxID=3137712 RepID=UPI003B43C0B4